jgi:hypothetical protein
LEFPWSSQIEFPYLSQEYFPWQNNSLPLLYYTIKGGNNGEKHYVSGNKEDETFGTE